MWQQRRQVMRHHDGVHPDGDGGSGAGASAQRKGDRLSAKRQERIRAAHPRLGGLILALSDDPRSTKAWQRGAEGERRVARRLDELVAEGKVVLHDRRIPGSKANIDHIVIAPSGVYVIDTKRYTGRLEVRTSGGLFRPGPTRLFVNGRDKSRLVDGMARQIAAVATAAGDLLGSSPIPALCFVDVEVGLLTKPFTIDGVAVTWPRPLLRRLRERGPLGHEEIAALGERLSSALPRA